MDKIGVRRRYSRLKGPETLPSVARRRYSRLKGPETLPSVARRCYSRLKGPETLPSVARRRSLPRRMRAQPETEVIRAFAHEIVLRTYYLLFIHTYIHNNTGGK